MKKTLDKNKAKFKNGKKGRFGKFGKRQRANKKRCKKGVCKRKAKKDEGGNQKNCRKSDCLNEMVFALKIEKDTVKNFIAQEKRLTAKINLMSKYTYFNK